MQAGCEPLRMKRDAARKAISRYFELPAAAALSRVGLGPNAVTLLGLAIAGASAYLIATGNLLAGGAVLLASGAFDMLDGALARSTGKATRFGALLDSVVDRLAEALVLLGLLLHYTQRGPEWGAALVYAALVGSLMVSYLRARSEGLGIECKVGLMQRPERVVVLGIGLIAGHWYAAAALAALGAIAALTLFTMCQRLAHSWRSLGDEQ